MSFVVDSKTPYIGSIEANTNPGTRKVRDRSERNKMMTRFENNALTSIVQAGDLNTAATNLFRAVVQLPENFITQLYKWQVNLNDRKSLRDLSAAQLNDIGLTRKAADTEASIF